MSSEKFSSAFVFDKDSVQFSIVKGSGYLEFTEFTKPGRAIVQLKKMEVTPAPPFSSIVYDDFSCSSCRKTQRREELMRDNDKYSYHGQLKFEK